MAEDKPTLHHLNHSQSQRILWLLEELGIEYNLVLHARNPATDPVAPFYAPPALKAIGPFGKSPTLITGAADGNRIIPESSAIATYLIRTFDTEDKFGLRNGDWIRDEVLLSQNLTDLYRSTQITLYVDFGIIKEAGKMDVPELRRLLANLQKELEGGPPGGYFMGKEPGRADIMLEFQISFCKTRTWWVNLEEEFPLVDEWLKRIYQRPAWKRGMAKGNGYDLSIFPHQGRK